MCTCYSVCQNLESQKKMNKNEIKKQIYNNLAHVSITVLICTFVSLWVHPLTPSRGRALDLKERNFLIDLGHRV